MTAGNAWLCGGSLDEYGNRSRKTEKASCCHGLAGSVCSRVSKFITHTRISFFSVEGCQAGQGRLCPHETTKCTNYGGSHGARANNCAAKREVHQLAWRWTSPPRPRREALAPEVPEHETPVAQEGEEAGEVEVEARIEPSPEEMEE